MLAKSLHDWVKDASLENEPLKIKLTRTLGEEPVMAVAAAFVIGMYCTLFLYTLFNRRSD